MYMDGCTWVYHALCKCMRARHCRCLISCRWQIPFLPPVRIEYLGFDYDYQIGWGFGLDLAVGLGGGWVGGKIIVVQALDWSSPLVQFPILPTDLLCTFSMLPNSIVEPAAFVGQTGIGHSWRHAG